MAPQSTSTVTTARAGTPAPPAAAMSAPACRQAGSSLGGEATRAGESIVLVTGAGGMLGSAVVPALTAAGHQTVATDIKPGWTPLDVRDSAAVRAMTDKISPDVIIHLAAETNVDACEEAPHQADLTNADGTRNVAAAAAAIGAPLVYVSTAGVFDGRQDDPYTEADQPAPINAYGRSKLAGEEWVARLCDRYWIVRAGWMMGGGPELDHKFVGQILRQLRAGATTVCAVTDKCGSPTYTGDFAQCLLGLLNRGPSGIYHMACGGAPSRFQVASHMLAVLGLAHRIRLQDVTSGYFHRMYPAPRPPSEALQNAQLQELGLDTMRPWVEALTDYLTSDQAPAAEPGDHRVRPAPLHGPVGERRSPRPAARVAFSSRS